MMKDKWDVIGYVISSRYRVAVLNQLSEGPATPSRMATESDLSIAHVSRSLGELRDRELVTLLVPEHRKKGRVYGITDQGKDIWTEIQQKNLV